MAVKKENALQVAVKEGMRIPIMGENYFLEFLEEMIGSGRIKRLALYLTPLKRDEDYLQFTYEFKFEGGRRELWSEEEIKKMALRYRERRELET